MHAILRRRAPIALALALYAGDASRVAAQQNAPASNDPSAAIAGYSHVISWEPRGASTVDIRLWNGELGIYTMIATGLPERISKFDWAIPKDMHGSLFRVEIIRDHDMGNIERSKVYLTVAPATKAVTPSPSEKELPARDCAIAMRQGAEGIELTGDLSSVSSISLIDMVGMEVARVIPDRGHVIDIPTGNVVPGQYFVRATFGNGVQTTKKVVIIR